MQFTTACTPGKGYKPFISALTNIDWAGIATPTQCALRTLSATVGINSFALNQRMVI
jgi:hypothetical protein